MTKQVLLEIIMDYLDNFTTMTVACCQDNRPWAAAVYYARQDMDLVFFSSPESMHSVMLEKNAAAAATVNGDYREWREIKGLQLEGRVNRIATKLGKARAMAAYLNKYPFVGELFEPGTPGLNTAQKISRVELYTFRPSRIFYINNEAGFGTRWKIDMIDGRPAGEPTLTSTE